MANEAQTGATASPSATGPAQTGAVNDGQTGAAQTGAAQTGPAQTGPEGQTGPSGAAQTGATGATGATGPKVPEKYELKLPKDSVLDTAHLERIAAEAKARGLSQEDAQALVERDNALWATFAKEEAVKTEAYIKGWLDDAKADKEIGGENFTKNAELSYRVIEKFGTKEFKKALEDTGLGNHPELVRVFVKIGQAMGPDKFLPVGTTGKEDKSLADVFYGDKPNETKTE